MWKHIVGVAMVSRLIMKKNAKSTGDEEAYTAGFWLTLAKWRFDMCFA
jgi:hypothetical protein